MFAIFDGDQTLAHVQRDANFINYLHYVARHANAEIAPAQMMRMYGDKSLIQFEDRSAVDAFRNFYREVTGATVTGGIGNDVYEALQALTVAKARSRGDIEEYSIEIQPLADGLTAAKLEWEQKPVLPVEVMKNAVAHTERLQSLGYDVKAASKAIEEMYNLDTYRTANLLPEDHPDFEFFAHAAENWKIFINGLQREPVELQLNQKFVTANDIGMITNIGTRTATVQWLKQGKKERVPLSKLRRSVASMQYTPIPVTRSRG